ncbi:MAG: 2-oxoglutarate dehydrogenase, E2 component, dihydrolipoamide succinyltransferase [Gemmatimonadetes bacterium]|nr:2-oxoglutarate dehydrogenase, E2 component, dihydrolipoamide succinyltransferase [Gemmatimonadota bacterium]
MARIDVIMPQMGESITEGTMSRWIKQVGDAVKRDEPIFEISTDKVDAEIPAPNAGVLVEVLVTEGQTVSVGTVVARIDTEAAAGAAVTAAPAPAAAPAAASTPAPAAAAPPPPAPAPAPKAAPAPAPAAPGAEETAEQRLQRKSTPLVRKMVEEHGLDLAQIPGSGSAGRVTKTDVLSFLETGAPAAPSAPATPAPAAAPAAVVAVPAAPRAPSPAVEAWEGDRVEPWGRVRKLTADHMIMSRRVSAHVNSLMEIDYTHVAGIRKRLKGEFAERGVNLTYLAFIVKAIADNLRKHPVVNAAISGDNTIYRRDINVGIAVALDWGLIVPVIKHADELSLLGVARSIQDLAERARTKKLAPDDIQKGTFTITNPGGFGTYVGTPIINQPQVAILAVGAIEKRPSVITLPDGSDALGIRTKGMWCMAYDHRIVDGADADRFLADVRATLHAFPEQQG